MVDLSAKSAGELSRVVSQINIAVAARGEGRTTEQRERWSICRFLAAIAASDWLRYPLEVRKRERPDYVLNEAALFTGVEITEAVPPDWARVDVRRKEFGEQAFLLHRFHPGEPNRSQAEIERIARGILPSDGWAGDSPEREWADAIFHTFRRKVEVATKPGFQLFDRNVVLIYDNWPLPGVEVSQAAAYLMKQVGAASLSPFDAFFVECGREVWYFSANGYGSHPIPDLWDDG